jgi:hypothetical protein
MATKWTKDQPAVLGGDDPIDNDAEILIYADQNFVDDHSVKQLARLAFCNEMDISEEFIKKIMNIAEELRGVYRTFPDGYVHVQVRFNLNYCNMF